MPLQTNNTARIAVLCDGSGEVLDVQGDANESEALAAVAAFSMSQLVEAGQALGLGSLQRVTSQAKRITVLSLFQNGLIATAEWDGPQPIEKIEQLLKTLVAGHLSGPSLASAIDTSWADVALVVSTAATHVAALRRALAFGDLPSAENAVDKLAEVSRPVDSAWFKALESAIGAVQSGDQFVGISALRPLAESPQTDTPLRWVAYLWMARAALDCHQTAEAASLVDHSLDLAEQLDDRALALSRCIHARVELAKGDADAALGILAQARAPLQDGRDGPELAESWLVEADVLASLNRERESEVATNAAQASYRRWWAPTLYAARRALASNRLDEAERLVDQLRELGTPPAMLAREERLLLQVRTGVIPRHVPSRLIALQHSPPSESALAELESLVTNHPGCLALQDALAWALYRAGRLAASKRQFDSLAAQSLASDESASVMLGLACLATASSDATTQAGRVHAAVSAIPPRARSDTPVSPPPPAKLPWPQPSFDADSSGLAFVPLRSESSAAFAGEIAMFSLPELLEFLHAGRRSGTLVCSSIAGIGAVALRQGNITGAASPNGDNLGALLVQGGKLTQSQLNDALASQGGDRSPLLGEILVRSGAVSGADVRDALSALILSCLREMIRWDEGQFTFDPAAEGQLLSPEIAVDINPQAALLEIFRVQDEECLELTDDSFT